MTRPVGRAADARDDEPAAAHESRLIAAARAGSRAAFDRLVELHAEPLHAFLRLRCRSPQDAEELCQEAFLRAWQRLGQYDARWRFATWLYTLARRLAASRYRRPSPGTEGDVDLQASGSSDDPADAAIAREERRGLWGLADRVLDREQRSALWLRYGEDLDAREIGRILGRGSASVRLLLFRARRRLAAHLPQVQARHERAALARDLRRSVPALSGESKP